jgi:hypothetical protein
MMVTVVVYSRYQGRGLCCHSLERAFLDGLEPCLRVEAFRYSRDHERASIGGPWTMTCEEAYEPTDGQ